MTAHRSTPSRRSHLPDLNPPEPERAGKTGGTSALVIVASAMTILGLLLGAQINAMFTAHNAAVIEFREKVEKMK